MVTTTGVMLHETAALRPAVPGSGLIELAARPGNNELPFNIASGQADGALDDPEWLARKLVGIVVERFGQRFAAAHPELAAPQRT